MKDPTFFYCFDFMYRFSLNHACHFRQIWLAICRRAPKAFCRCRFEKNLSYPHLPPEPAEDLAFQILKLEGGHHRPSWLTSTT